MKILIGENIKKLRKKKDITQEKLAEALNISVTAVSKWEREETYPDITLIFPIAHFFNVSVDELMGYNKEKIEQDILDTIKEYHRLSRSYQSTREFITEAYKKYPNDYRIMNIYMWDTVDCADVKDEAYLEHLDEFTSICNRILEGCNDAKIVLDAKNMRAKLLKAQGKIDEAIALYREEFPDLTQDAYQKIEQLFSKDTAEYRYWNKMNIYRYMEFSAMKCARMFWYDDSLTKQEIISKCEKIIDLFTNARKETNESFLLVFEKSLIEQFLILMAAHNGEIDDIARFLDKLLLSAKAETEIVKTDTVLKNGVLVPYKTDNILAYYINHWKTSDHWSIASLRQNKKIQEIIKKYDN
ncbi:MAG: helix-turn-helix transcriptional regulator [Clostridia bacterium]|nr:helix-turn-helix transcriptional regulator [Clostridia bacterium]